MQERLVPGEAEWTQYAAHHLARYLFATDFAQGRRVLDAGTGSGYGARLLKTAGAASVYGIDIDPAAVELARQRFSGEGLTFEEDDCQQPAKVSGPFDLICNFENLEHLEHPERFLAAATRLLSPDGVLLVSSPDRAATPPFVNGRPRNPFHVNEWYQEEFQNLLAPYFAEIDLRVQVQSTALASRLEAVAALREGLLWSNPLLVTLWRKLPWVPKAERPWKKLIGLAAPSVTDYPVLPQATASLFGHSWFHVAICRQPKRTGEGASNR